MKKKTFYQSKVIYQLFCFLFLVAFIIESIIGVQLIVGFFNKGLGENVLHIVGSLILLILYCVAVISTLWVFIKLEHNNIHFNCEKIYMYDDWNGKRDKVQHYSEAKFADVESVDIIWTHKNSKNKTIPSRWMSSSLPKPYLSIKSTNGKVANFFIMYFSKKTILKIVAELNIRMKNVGNEKEIINEEDVLMKLNPKIYS